MLSIKRPLLCWENRENTTGHWEKSQRRSYWRPSLSHYPDTRAIRAGDIVLFQPVRPSFTQKLIQTYESGTFTHAAVYIEADHILCEASAAKGKVVFSSLEDYLKANCILVRRITNLSADGRARVAEFATSLVSREYQFGPLIRQVLTRGRPVQDALKNPNVISEPLICSTLCEHAIVAGLADGQSITKRNGHLIMPEDLASTTLLEDVSVSWKFVGGRLP